MLTSGISAYRIGIGSLILTAFAIGLASGCRDKVNQGVDAEPPSAGGKPSINKPEPTQPKIPGGEKPSTNEPERIQSTISVRTTNVNVDWALAMQDFDLVFQNDGDEPAEVHAVVYGRNDSVSPPLRALSPSISSAGWFRLSGSERGLIFPGIIEQNWTRNTQQNKAWKATIQPKGTETIEASLLLPAASPFPAWKGQRLAKVAYEEVEVWLFTPAGMHFGTFKTRW